MLDYIEHLLINYRSQGILVDASLLLLYVVGLVERPRIERFKRTATFTVADFELLARLLENFEHIVTTPSVLTEVSNFLGQLPKHPRHKGLLVLRKLVKTFTEEYREARQICARQHFITFRLTDTGIIEVATNPYVVLTDDLPLYHFLASKGQPVLNFNHLREANW